MDLSVNQDLSNVFGWNIIDRKGNFYLDNWQFNTFSDAWNNLWKEILSKFNIIFNSNPNIKLLGFIYDSSNMTKISDSDLEMCSRNSLFLYRWKLCGEKSHLSTECSLKFKDIVSCHNSMIDFLNNAIKRGSFFQMEITLEYQRLITKISTKIKLQRQQLFGIKENENEEIFTINDIDLQNFIDLNNYDT